ncbi:MAG: CDP-alcohol phosphatidyltransferase family protein [Phycisphaerales bacterium]
MPNWLTASRVVMALVFFGVLTLWRFEGSAAAAGRIDWLLLSSAALFIVASLTDVLDGHLARRWRVESTFGRIMDPFADKVLVIGALVFLAGPDFWYHEAWSPGMAGGVRRRLAGEGVQLSGVYPWMAVTIIGRELLVTSIRGVLEARGVKFGADWSGKLKMLLQSVAVPTVLITIGVTRVTPWGAGEPHEGAPWGRQLIDIAVWTALCATVLSGLPYVARAVALARRRGMEETR